MKTIVITGALLAAAGLSHAQMPVTPATSSPSIEVIDLSAQRALVMTVEAKPVELESALARAYLTVYAEAQGLNLVLDGAPIARYVHRGSPTSLAKVEAGFPLRGKPPKKLGRKLRVVTLPAGPAAVFDHKGRRETLAFAHAELDRWINAKGHRVVAPRWEIYETNPMTTPDPAAQRTRIVVPIEKTPR